MQRYCTFLPSTIIGSFLLLFLFMSFKPAGHFPDQNCRLYIPNVFSPNGDGVNDLFLPQTSPDCSILDYELTIMDRWGGVVFQTTNINNGWDGVYEGQQMEEGTYVYNIEYGFAIEMDSTSNSVIELEHGEINLVR